jgi:hypothetical protein
MLPHNPERMPKPTMTEKVLFTVYCAILLSGLLLLAKAIIDGNAGVPIP